MSSFVMIATGSASSASPVRTLSLRALAIVCIVLALGLLGLGVAMGLWLSGTAPARVEALQQRGAGAATPATASTMPFALEQLGALSGRLFKLESQASQLSERLGAGSAARSGARSGAASRELVNAPAAKPGSGGPMLPPRPAMAEALAGLDALEARLVRMEQQLARVSDASAQRHLDLMRWPTRMPIAQGEMTSPFGNREDPITGRRAFHAGIDFAAGVGTPIHAAAGGNVIFAGFRSDYGWMVEIEHGNGLTTRYAHASRLLVKQDTVVTPGEVIAMSGSTGRSTGPHLHFEVLNHGEATDPRRYLAGL